MAFSEKQRSEGGREGSPGAFKKTDSPALLKKQASILIVDDIPIVRRMAARVAQSAGYTDVTEIDNRDKALKLIEELTSRGKDKILCISDFDMPNNMDYNSFREEVLKRNPNVRIILITGTIVEAKDAGAVADISLAKPFAIEDLKAAIGHLLDGQGQ